MKKFSERFIQHESALKALDVGRELTAILAVNEDGVIGRGDDEIPWRCSPDLKRFKELTTGNVAVFGYKTYVGFTKHQWKDSVILPGRDVVVLYTVDSVEEVGPKHDALMSLQGAQAHGGRLLALPMLKPRLLHPVIAARQLQHVIADIKLFKGPEQKIYVCGGSNTYNLFQPHLRDYEVTVIDAEVEGEGLVSIRGAVAVDLARAGVIFSSLFDLDKSCAARLVGEARDERTGVGAKFFNAQALVSVAAGSSR